MAAVCAGWAADAAAVAAQLLHDGHQDLLRDVAVYLANSGGLGLAGLAAAIALPAACEAQEGLSAFTLGCRVPSVC
jgi:hypothetical protein